MASENAERLARYKERLRAADFKRLSFWVCSDLAALLAAKRRPGECTGRTVERLLLGAAAARPEYWTAEERKERAARAARNRRDSYSVARMRSEGRSAADNPPAA
ncbi:hypothetical protein [Caballeronia sp. GAWG1-5s-s]|uniref:hypothetical protein n=1 Tax=Caballeronia sp. GAWG1-5s-s TaxID=2921743 RepID=UPI00202987BA|nr:hypothetical protein [Caballeronia sp. GAWG1-5s-s]